MLHVAPPFDEKPRLYARVDNCAQVADTLATTGVFVRTHLAVSAGAPVTLRLVSADRAPVDIEARVVARRLPRGAHGTSGSKSGKGLAVGLQIKCDDPAAARRALAA